MVAGVVGDAVSCVLGVFAVVGDAFGSDAGADSDAGAVVGV